MHHETWRLIEHQHTVIFIHDLQGDLFRHWTRRLWRGDPEGDPVAFLHPIADCRNTVRKLDMSLVDEAL
jgi:hypothetical protein